jgi:3-methylfumaryl-CoA hydratase
MSGLLERTGLLLPWPAMAFAGLIGAQAPDLENGEPLPLLWHWLYLLEHPATEDLGEDGHPVRGVIPVPPGPGRRRMIAGGRVRRRGDLRCGEEATRRTSIESTVEKIGRSGPMTFVAVRHEIHQRGQLVIEERQDVVYRKSDLGDPAHRPAGARHEPPAAGWALDTSPSLLFRFSALTYNAHRIHYDRAYAQEVEGYPGLVVHGPLQAMLMTEAARSRRAQPRLVEFSFRLVAPVFDRDGVVVTARPTAAEGQGDVETSVHSGDGRLTATGLLTGLPG